MERSEILEVLRTQLLVVLDVPADDIIPEARLSDALGADSVDLIEVAGVLEQRYDIAIDDRDLHDLVTVDDFVALLERKLI